LARLGAQCHADADFARALRHGLRHHPENSERAQERGERAEKAHQLRDDAVWGVLNRHEGFEGIDAGDGLVRIDALDGSAHRGGNRTHVSIHARRKSQIWRRHLLQGNVHLPLGPGPELIHLESLHDADNGCDGFRVAIFQLLA
jgi:hypothetical protein